MKWAESLEDVAKGMEEDAAEAESYEALEPIIKGAVRQIRMLVRLAKSEEEERAKRLAQPPPPVAKPVDHRAEIEKVRMQMRMEKEEKLAEKGVKVHGRDAAAIADGALAGVVIPVDPFMPIGAYTKLGSVFYVMGVDGKLHVKQELTGIITS